MHHHHLLPRYTMTPLKSFCSKNTTYHAFTTKKARKFGTQKCEVGKESEFQMDPEKAREALRKLDEQLQSVSNKPMNTPKIRAADMKWSSVSQTQEKKEEVVAEIPESLLASVATVLVLFTIFYNVLFITVIKPSIDSPYTQQQELPNIDVPLSP